MFTVSLPQHNTKYTFDRERFLSLFPGSLIGTTLEMCPSETDIELTQSCITQEIMTFLEQLCTTRNIPTKIPHQVQLLEAGRYLLMDVFPVITAPQWKWFMKYMQKIDPSFNLLTYEDIELNEYTTLSMYTFLAENNYVALAKYLSARDITTYMIDHLKMAIKSGNLELVNLFLKFPRIDLSRDAPFPFPCLGVACRYGHLDIVNRLLQDPRVCPDGHILNHSYYSGQFEVVKRLLQDPRTVIFSSVVRDAFRASNYEMAKLFSEDPRCDLEGCREEIVALGGIRDPTPQILFLYKELWGRVG